VQSVHSETSSKPPGAGYWSPPKGPAIPPYAQPSSPPGAPAIPPGAFVVPAGAVVMMPAGTQVQYLAQTSAPDPAAQTTPPGSEGEPAAEPDDERASRTPMSYAL